jgi:hypothetical protein
MRRRHLWLAAAALLLLLSAGLLSLVEAPAGPPRTEVRFPSHMREAERTRWKARQSLPPRPAPATAAGAPRPDAEPPPRRDPFLVALPVKPGEPVVVFEANALRHSRLGELFIACAMADDPRALATFQEETGVDPLKDIDRIGVVGRSVVVSGFFDRARWDRLVDQGKLGVTPHGEGGRIYADGPGRVMAVWRDQLVVLAPDEAAARLSLDQLEGRAPAPEPAIPEELAYGEVYGVIPGAAVQRLFSAADRELGAKLAAAASRVELHVDAMEDVAAVVRVDGEDRAALGDLARTLGGALAAGRLRAKAGSDQPLVELLDSARVVDEGGRLSLELALPAATLERWFEGCAGRQGRGGP